MVKAYYTLLLSRPPLLTFDIVRRATLADCFLVMDCLYDTDLPTSYQLSVTRYLPARRPHHLMIALASCTIRVFHFSEVFLSRSRFYDPVFASVFG
jgi:hypothetical protein